eukprot:1581457-Rhodomonas_salina.1
MLAYACTSEEGEEGRGKEGRRAEGSRQEGLPGREREWREKSRRKPPRRQHRSLLSSLSLSALPLGHRIARRIRGWSCGVQRCAGITWWGAGCTLASAFNASSHACSRTHKQTQRHDMTRKPRTTSAAPDAPA